MKHYIDIELKPDTEMPLNWLTNAVYTKLHKVLVDAQSNNIGVSFPRYQQNLGDLLRLHGTETELSLLMKADWLGGMKGYCDVSGIQVVPEGAAHRTISRKRQNQSNSKLKRLLKRGSIKAEQVNAYKAKMFSAGLDAPYVEIVSGSTNQRYRRYFQFGALSDSPVNGTFDQFGLSKTTTIPWF